MDHMKVPACRQCAQILSERITAFEPSLWWFLCVLGIYQNFWPWLSACRPLEARRSPRRRLPCHEAGVEEQTAANLNRRCPAWMAHLFIIFVWKKNSENHCTSRKYSERRCKNVFNTKKSENYEKYTFWLVWPAGASNFIDSSPTSRVRSVVHLSVVTALRAPRSNRHVILVSIENLFLCTFGNLQKK